jgi:phthiocerol/phenolphthiocerol synthesis type-I polyketide synthase C
MFSKGAKHLILVSRSGAASAAAQNAVASLRDEGCDVKALACDVSNKDQLQQVLNQCSDLPIKGCIQGAMVLEVFRLITMHCSQLTLSGLDVLKHDL